MVRYTKDMTRTVVGVLRGGPSPEYEVSLKTGTALMNALSEDRYDVRDVFIDRSGAWHLHGRASEPPRVLSQVDVVVNGLHGVYGEDGQVQRVLERSGVPFTGARSSVAALTMHKGRTRDALKNLGILMPRGMAFTPRDAGNSTQLARQVFQQFGPPYVVKPIASGSSVGVVIVTTLNALPDALETALEAYGAVLVEEQIFGREATVGIVDRFREQDHYSLPAVEIIPKGHTFFDYEAKYGGVCDELCPSTFGQAEKQQLEDAARLAHQSLGLSHYSRSDFIVHPSGRVYFLEINALPGLTEQSLLPKALVAVGSSLPEFAEHLVRLALQKA